MAKCKITTGMNLKDIIAQTREIARHQLETCKFAIHYPANQMFGAIDDCTALVKPFCKLEGKPCAFYKQG